MNEDLTNASQPPLNEADKQKLGAGRAQNNVTPPQRQQLSKAQIKRPFK